MEEVRITEGILATSLPLPIRPVFCHRTSKLLLIRALHPHLPQGRSCQQILYGYNVLLVSAWFNWKGLALELACIGYIMYLCVCALYTSVQWIILPLGLSHRRIVITSLWHIVSSFLCLWTGSGTRGTLFPGFLQPVKKYSCQQLVSCRLKFLGYEIILSFLAERGCSGFCG